MFGLQFAGSHATLLGFAPRAGAGAVLRVSLRPTRFEAGRRERDRGADHVAGALLAAGSARHHLGASRQGLLQFKLRHYPIPSGAPSVLDAAPRVIRASAAPLWTGQKPMGGEGGSAMLAR